MLRSRSHVALASVPFLLVAACAAEKPSSSLTGKLEQPVFSRDPATGTIASNDPSTPVKNVVVRIPSIVPNAFPCTGVLITTSLVLTSRLCASPARSGDLPNVDIGGDNGAFVRRRSARRPAFMDPVLDGDKIDTHDLALLYLELPRTPAELALASVSRPTLAPPTSGTAPIVPPQPGGNRTFPKVEMVGWGRTGVNKVCESEAVPAYDQHRQSVTLQDANLFWLTQDQRSPLFARTVYAPLQPGTARAGLQEGDFGSPLFVYANKSDAVGQLVGIATTIGMAGTAGASAVSGGEHPSPARIAGTNCDTSRCDVWVDLTAPEIRNWVTQNAQVHDNDGKRYWQRAHARRDGITRPNTPGIYDWWYGEADYAGPCQARDADCDGWYDTNDNGSRRDNCPSFNFEQPDQDDDWNGDACDTNPAGDPDMDGRTAGDSCPVYNPDQVDRDADGVGDACDFCPDVYNTDINAANCAATCATQLIDGSNPSIGVKATPKGTVSSPGAYGSASCDSWVVEWNPADVRNEKGTVEASFDTSDIAQAQCVAWKGGANMIVWGLSATNNQWVEIGRTSSTVYWSGDPRPGTFDPPKGCHIGYANFTYDNFRVPNPYRRMRAGATGFKTLLSKGSEYTAKPVMNVRLSGYDVPR